VHAYEDNSIYTANGFKPIALCMAIILLITINLPAPIIDKYPKNLLRTNVEQFISKKLSLYKIVEQFLLLRNEEVALNIASILPIERKMS